ncbi:C2 domain-containing protein, partial [Catenaria anguillulae PL171]
MTIGILKIYCIRGSNLFNCDKSSKQDPYLNFKLGNMTVSTTAHSRGGLNPSWFQTVDLLVHPKFAKTKEDADALITGKLAISAWDEDLMSNDFIGSCTLDISPILAGKGCVAFNGEVKLMRDREGGQAGMQDAGMVRLHISFVELSEDDCAIYEKKLAKAQIKEGAGAVLKIGKAVSKIAANS